MNEELYHIITLVLGDWSHDGHCVSHNEYIKSNLSAKEINIAYTVGKKVIKIDLIEDVCRGYDENFISFEDLKKFIDAGFLETKFKFNKNDLKSIKNQETIEYIDSGLFVALYLFTVSCGNDKFKYEIVEDNENNINIGGYGIFGN